MGGNKNSKKNEEFNGMRFFTLTIAMVFICALMFAIGIILGFQLFKMLF